MFDEEEEEPVLTWGKTIVPHDHFFGMCVEEEGRCRTCAYCALFLRHSAPARRPCSGPGCQGDACRDARGGLCTECGYTKCATVEGCPHRGMAPRGQLICTRCASRHETPTGREERQALNNSDPANALSRKVIAGFGKGKRKR